MRTLLLVVLFLPSCGPTDRCDNPCELGQTFCSSDGGLVACRPAGDGECLRWSSPESCGDQRACADGACVCADECASGDERCGPNEGRVPCEGPDSNGCYRWGSEESCEPDGCPDLCGCPEDCSPGESSCAETGELLVCRGPDEFGCFAQEAETCGEHQICWEDECTCRTACTPGMWVCNGFEGRSPCLGPDEAGCVFFGESEPCPAYRRCDGTRGRCERETPAQCYPVNQCDFEGQLLCMDETRYRECFRTRRGCLLWNGCET